MMTTKEVADEFYGLAQTGDFAKIVAELYSPDCESTEAGSDGKQETVKGLDALKKKGTKFNEAVEEMHGGHSSRPVVSADYFAVSMGMDVTMKGESRKQMDEIALYKVKDGKIISEQFFY